MRQKFLVVVTEPSPNKTKTLDEIFTILWKNGLVDSHVLIQKDNSWLLYAFKPYQSDCSSLAHVKIASFTLSNYTENITLSFEELYPLKLQNFNKCPLRVTVNNIQPFAMHHITNNGNISFSGIEIVMIEQIAKTFNFSIIYKTSLQDRGLMLENGTATGNLNLIKTGQADLGIGSNQRTNVRSMFLVGTDPILYSSLSFVSKEPKFKLSNTIRLNAPFKFSIWFLICVIISLTIVLILLSKRLTRKWRHFYIGGRMNRSPILNMWLLVLGKSMTNPFIANGRYVSKFARTLILLWIILWFIIRSCYEGTLYSEFQSNQLDQTFDTIKKIQASDCKLFIQPSVYPFLETFFNSKR